MSDDKPFKCDECPAEFKTNSGLWKHKKNKHGDAPISESSDNLSPVHALAPSDTDDEGDNPSIPASQDNTIWNTWSRTIVDDSTEKIPTPLKVISATGKVASGAKLTKAQRKALDEKSVALLKMGLTGADALIGIYGRAITLDPDYSCRHSDGEKTIVEEAQLDAFKDKGIEVTSVLSPTTVAVALTAGYIVPPIAKLQKNKKRKLLKNGGKSLLSRIPIIGRRFRKKEQNDFFNQSSLEDYKEVNE